MAKKKAERESPFVPVEEQPYQVPENWCWVYLTNGFAECCDFFRKPINATERANLLGDVPYYGATGQVGWINDYLTEEQLVLLGEDGAPFLDMLKDKAYLIEGKAWVNNHAHILRSYYGNTGNLYLVHYLNCFDYKGYVNGTTRLKLTQANMNRIPIPLAPLFEQQRIVARLESLFAKLDEVKEKVQEALAGFETRKVAVLYHAFTGKLTEKWRKANGIERTSWRLQLFSDLGSCQLGKMLDIEKNQGTMIDYLRNINVRWFDFDLSNIAQIRATDTEINKFSVHRGDLFICEGGEPGRCAIWKYDNQVLIFQKALHRFRAKENVLPQFVAYSILEKSLSGELNKYFTGTTIKHLTGKSLATLPVSLPTFDEQTEIVRILDEFFELEAQAKTRAETVLKAIDTMKKSILAKAFRGELGTNNPKDESAEELLKRTLA